MSTIRKCVNLYGSFTEIRKRHRGLTAVWTALVIVVTMGFCSLALDYGMVQTAKTELRNAADAAARAAVAGIATSVTQAQNNAIAIAAANTCAGTAVTLTTSDIDFGTWDTTLKTFTTLSGAARSNANAIRVNAKRTAANGNPINLLFARVVGKSTCDVHATAISLVTGKLPGITGIDTIKCHNAAFFASYDSSVTTTPTEVSHNNNVCIGCNNQLGSGAAAGSPSDIWGNVQVGPTCVVNTAMTIHGTKTVLGADIPTPSDPPMVVVTNPGGYGSTYSFKASTSYSMPGGTYYFSTMQIDNKANLNFTASAIVYLDGNLGSNAKGSGPGTDAFEIHAYNDIPSNLIIYQSSGNTFNVHNDFVFTGQYYGPNATMLVNDRLLYYGNLQVNKLTLHDNCDIFYDERLGNANSTSVVSLVQ